MKKIFIGVCNSQEQMPSAFFWSMIGQVDFVAQPMFARAVHPWDVIRNNQLIDWFLKTDCEYFVKTDVDQVYPNDYFKRMVPLLDKYEVIGPLIFDRPYQSGFTPLVNWLDSREHYDIKGKTGIEEVPYLHTNCFFRRDVLEKIPRPWYEVQMTADGMGRANHIDGTFMKKIPAAGFHIYLNYDVVVDHLATVPISRGVYERWNN